MSSRCGRNACARLERRSEPAGYCLPRDGERRRRAMRGEAALDHDVDELGRGQEVALVRREDVAARIAILGLADASRSTSSGTVAMRPPADHARIGAAVDLHVLGDRVLHFGDAARIDRPVVGVAALDAVPARHVDVVEQRLAIALREVEHRVVGGDRVVDRLAEVPHLRRDRERQVAARDHAIRHEADRLRRRVADRSRSAGRPGCGSRPSSAGRRSTTSSSSIPIASSRRACLRRRSACASPRRPGRAC